MELIHGHIYSNGALALYAQTNPGNPIWTIGLMQIHTYKGYIHTPIVAGMVIGAMTKALEEATNGCPCEARFAGCTVQRRTPAHRGCRLVMVVCAGDCGARRCAF